MLLNYCQGCRYHEIGIIDGDGQSKCTKENCLAVYTKCVTEEAVKQFLQNDRRKEIANPAALSRATVELNR